MQPIKRLRFFLCLLVLLCLCGCSLLPPAQPSGRLPDLRQLSMPAFEETIFSSAGEGGQNAPLQVDLWLDASQVMGGINPVQDSLYPHKGVKYREGGFHYRYENQVGWYENLLRDMLSAAEGSRVRILRAGNERISDQLLLSSGLAASDDPALLRSLRRDLLTYAIDPMPTVFTAFSGESMQDSFYSPFSPQMNRIAQFAQDGGVLLENPGKTDEMDALLTSVVASYNPKKPEETLPLLLTDRNNPLTYALDNLDPSRLSVITCDPATFRRLSTTAADGSTIAFIQEAVEERGIFDKGLAVGLYAFQLDYLGQMTAITDADLSQPLIWGRMDYNQSKNKLMGVLPMPRILLTLVVGSPAHVTAFTGALNAALDTDSALRGLRGPEKGQLTYSKDGQTVTQQPFSFAYEYTLLRRHAVEPYTLRSPGMTMTLSEGVLLEDTALPTVALPYEEGASGQREITVSWPLEQLEGGLSLDPAQLSSLKAEGIASLVLTRTEPNLPTALPEPGVQTLTLRDTLYHFAYTQENVSLPCTAKSLRISDDGSTLLASFTLDNSQLKPGYYRLRLTADIAGDQLTWPQVEWVSRLNATITNEQISSWQLIADALSLNHRKGGNIPNRFTHAWGEDSGSTYRDVLIPDCPPVYAAPRLLELFTQLQSAAETESTPFICCELDLFVAPAEQIAGL
ncbi:MAG: hypothetical protein E7319_05490 [Clostridiales bacterium]|nr:hypothetical protein [Clostridiales bacterium]